MNTAENDNLRIGLGSLPSQAKGVSDIVRDLLDGIDLVIMAEKDGILFFLKSKNFFLIKA